MTRWTRLLGIASLVGITAGLAAAGLKAGLHLGSAHLVGRFTGLGEAEIFSFRLGLLLLPALGGLAAGLLVHSLCPKLEGHGTDLLIRAFHRQGGDLPVAGPAVNAAAAVGVISCGGSAGPEGPIAALGAAIGSTLGKLFTLTPRERRIMLIAGCGAGIGAIFQCPLGGALFAASILYREPDFETDAIMPAFIASVVGYSVYMSFWGYGSHLLHDANTLVFSSPRELIPYAVLGPVCGVVVLIFRGCLKLVEHGLVRRLRVPRWLAPALGGLATGGLACLLPQVMDGQYFFIQNAMDGTLLGGFEERSWWWWAALFGAVTLAKCLATGFTVGSGSRGGVLGPSVFIGGAAGAFMGAVVAAIAPDTFAADPENLRRALIPAGMAGVLAASMRAPLASLVMVTEMTGSYGLLVPLMLVCVSAYVVGRRWGLNDEQVRSSLESPAHAGDVVVHLLELGRVREVMRRPWPEAVSPETTLREMVGLAKPGSQPVFAVVDRGHLQGLISVADLKNIMDEPGVSDVIIAADMMTPAPRTVHPDDDLYYALTLMARDNQIVLPVVTRFRDGEFLGMLTRADVYETVRADLEDMRGHLLREHKGLVAIDREETLHQLVTGASLGTSENVQRLFVPLQAVGRSLRESDFRRQFGVQIIAVEQPDGSIQCPPDVDCPLETKQRLIGVVSEQPQSPYRKDEG